MGGCQHEVAVLVVVPVLSAEVQVDAESQRDEFRDFARGDGYRWDGAE